MVKNLKKSLITCLGVLLISVMPNIVFAANYRLGTAVTESNVTTIPVYLEVSESEESPITGGRIGCQTDHTSVTCEVKLVNDSGAFGTSDATGLAFNYVGDGVITSFPPGSIHIVDLVVTNTTNSKKDNLKISLNNSKINGNDVTLDSIYTEVGAKPVEKEKSDDAKAKEIKFSQGIMEPSFSPDVYEYTVYKIADTINSVRVNSSCNTGECDITLHGGKSISGSTVTLNQGENKITVEVTSEDGQNTNNYTFKVIRGETGFNSAKLATLSFGDYVLTPAFSSDITEYTMTIPNQVNSLNSLYKYTAQDENAKVNAKGLDNFVVGENTITITVDNVTSSETITYKVKVTRMALEDIEIISYANNEIVFTNSEGIQSKLSTKDFELQYPTEYKKITGGEYKFDTNGNIIKEQPVEPSTTPKEEEPAVKKKNNNLWIIILLIVVGLAIIIVSGILIFKKPKNKEEKEINEENKGEEATDIDENGIEEAIIENETENKDETVDVDEALNDLMNTKQYDFKNNDEEE